MTTHLCGHLPLNPDTLAVFVDTTYCPKCEAWACRTKNCPGHQRWPEAPIQKDYKGREFTGTPQNGYEAIGLGFAVFNGHVNQADKRARALMSVVAPRFLEEVEEIEREGNGIMAIFQREDTSATIMYASLVTAFVNEQTSFSRVDKPAPTLEQIQQRGNAKAVTV